MLMASDLILSEYLQLQKTVEDYDARALTIKAWSVTFSAAGLGLAYAENTSAILLIASLSAAAFWMVEALWKNHQRSFYLRIKAIEAAERNKEDIPPLQIASSWSESWREAGGHVGAFKILLWPHVALPHIFVFGIGLALYWFLPPAVG